MRNKEKRNNRIRSRRSKVKEEAKVVKTYALS